MIINEVTKDSKVTFSCSMNMQGANSRETFTLESLGWEGEQGKELSVFIQECYDNWLMIELDSGWFLEEGEE